MEINSFVDAERLEGVSYSRPAELSKLEAWYDSARTRPFHLLSMNDLCIACRQEVYVDHLAQRIVEELIANPLAGEMCDGELLIYAAKALPRFEPPLSADLARLKQVLADLLEHADELDVGADERVPSAAASLLVKLGVSA